jgi:hypothetical protein
MTFTAQGVFLDAEYLQFPLPTTPTESTVMWTGPGPVRATLATLGRIKAQYR